MNPSLPHFISESYTDQISKIFENTTDGQCAIDECSESDNVIDTSSNRFYYGFFIAGQREYILF